MQRVWPPKWRLPAAKPCKTSTSASCKRNCARRARCSLTRNEILREARVPPAGTVREVSLRNDLYPPVSDNPEFLVLDAEAGVPGDFEHVALYHSRVLAPVAVARLACSPHVNGQAISVQPDLGPRNGRRSLVDITPDSS